MASWEAKLARADYHINTLNRETDRWGDGNPLASTRERNSDGSEHLFRVRVKVEADVWGWATILGDALHNLRGALDHIVFALAIAQTGKDPPEDENVLAFPICSEPKFFPGQQFRIQSLDDPTKAAIERAQPYNRLKPGKWFMPLWWLSSLHDVDKHRFSHLAPFAAKPDQIVIGARPGTYTALWNTNALEDGAPVLHISLTEPDPDVYVDFQATAAVVLKAKDIRPIGIQHVARRIRREVGVVCRYLSGFFPAT
jgi:hypothetical protein